MSAAIEITHGNILTRIRCVRMLLEIFSKKNIPTRASYMDEIDQLSEDYELGSIAVLTEYAISGKNYHNFLTDHMAEVAKKEEINSEYEVAKLNYATEKEDHVNRYQNFISQSGFVFKIERIFSTLRSTIHGIFNKKSNENIISSAGEIIHIFSMYDNAKINMTVSAINYIMCDQCQVNMHVVSNSSELICMTCGLSRELTGTVCEDEQFYYQEGRTKHGSYDPSKHCRLWLERIQARESKDIPDDVINAVKKCIITNRIKSKEKVTCKLVRQFLRITRFSKFNEHVPLIRKIITGIAPPQLTDKECQAVGIYFDKIIRVYNQIKPANKTNSPFHPYFIYKILEHLLVPGIRAREILSCIHLQSCETLIKNDLDWKKICDRIGDIKYKETDRNAF